MAVVMRYRLSWWGAGGGGNVQEILGANFALESMEPVYSTPFTMFNSFYLPFAYDL